jgi:hypothetical protein
MRQLFPIRFLTRLPLIAGCLGGLLFSSTSASALDYEDYPIIKLRTLDKITARTMTFEAKVGTTMKFGEIYIKVQTCRKPPPIQKSEAAAFLQIWQIDEVKNISNWIFSGWMFASSPTLSAMDHPVYDVWVIDCLGKDPEKLPPPEETAPTGDSAIIPPGADQPQPPAEQPDSEPQTETETGPLTPEMQDEAVEESVPASNLPADAEPVPDHVQPEPETTPAIPPIEAAPDSHTPEADGIY